MHIHHLPRRTRTLILASLALILATSIASLTPPPPRIEFFNRGYNAFGNEKWLVDRQTGISMSFENNSGEFYDFFSMRFSSLKGSYFDEANEKFQWVGEFFCEPDNVIILDKAGNLKASYLPYLYWDKDFFVSEDGQSARVSARRSGQSGILTDYVPDKYLSAELDLNLDIRVDRTMYAGENYVRANIYITNRYDIPVSLDYIYQDAPFMNFLDGNSVGVQPLMINLTQPGSLSEYTAQANTTGLNFAGSYRENYNILAGLYTDNPSAYLGTTTSYVGIESKEVDAAGIGRKIVQQTGLEDLVETLTQESNPKTNPKSIVNRFISFPIKDLQPGEEIVFSYYQIMIDESDQPGTRSQQYWERKVREVIAAIDLTKN